MKQWNTKPRKRTTKPWKRIEWKAQARQMKKQRKQRENKINQSRRKLTTKRQTQIALIHKPRKFQLITSFAKSIGKQVSWQIETVSFFFSTLSAVFSFLRKSFIQQISIACDGDSRRDLWPGKHGELLSLRGPCICSTACSIGFPLFGFVSANWAQSALYRNNGEKLDRVSLRSLSWNLASLIS